MKGLAANHMHICFDYHQQQDTAHMAGELLAGVGLVLLLIAASVAYVTFNSVCAESDRSYLHPIKHIYSSHLRTRDRVG